MAISGKHGFSNENIAKAPTDDGVYVLYDRREVIYIGKGKGTNGIRSRLQSHKRGDVGRCTQQATAFRCRRHTKPLTYERRLLLEYKRKYSKLPRCNDLIP